jgi:hypothetical protein
MSPLLPSASREYFARLGPCDVAGACPPKYLHANIPSRLAGNPPSRAPWNSPEWVPGVLQARG